MAAHLLMLAAFFLCFVQTFGEQIITEGTTEALNFLYEDAEVLTNYGARQLESSQTGILDKAADELNSVLLEPVEDVAIGVEKKVEKAITSFEKHFVFIGFLITLLILLALICTMCCCGIRYCLHKKRIENIAEKI